MCPRQLAVGSTQLAAFGDEVIHTTASFGIARIPVLDRGVLDLGVLVDDDFHNGGVKLVLVAHRSGASFEIGDVAPVVADDEGAFELPRVARINAEIGGQLHGAAYALRDVDERAVGEYRTVEGCEEVVAVGDDGTEIFAHEVGIFADGLADGAEHDTFFCQLFLKGGFDRYGIHDGIDGYAGQGHALFEGNAQFVERFHQLRVDFFLVGAAFFLCRVGVVRNTLVVDGREVDMGPIGLLQGLPIAEGLETEVEHPLRFALLFGNEAYDVLVEAGVDNLGMDVGGEAVFVLLLGDLANELVLFLFVFGHVSGVYWAWAEVEANRLRVDEVSRNEPKACR